jgi:hypothetical protein
MTAYDATDWTEFFTASASASAALAGLVFVAVSINVERILQFKGLPERALASSCSCAWCSSPLSASYRVRGKRPWRPSCSEQACCSVASSSAHESRKGRARSKPGARREPLAPRRARDDPLRRGRGEPVGRCGRRALLDRGRSDPRDGGRRRHRLGAARRDPALTGPLKFVRRPPRSARFVR